MDRYRLKILTVSGEKHYHYFSDYASLDYNATFCQFSTNIVKAWGEEVKGFRWKTLFTIP